MDSLFRMLVTSFATICTVLFGGYDIAIQLLLISMLIDYVTGIIRSFMHHDLSSETGFHGILKKCGMLAMVTVAVIADLALNLSGVLRLAVIYYIMSNELLSVVENLGEIGVPVPAKLAHFIKKLEEMHDQIDDKKKD